MECSPYLRVRFSNHLNIRLVLNSNGLFVSGCQMIWYSNDGSENWTEKSLLMVQNVQYLNGPPSHVTLPFEYPTPVCPVNRYSDGYCIWIPTVLFSCFLDLKWLLVTLSIFFDIWNFLLMACNNPGNSVSSQPLMKVCSKVKNFIVEQNSVLKKQIVVNIWIPGVSVMSVHFVVGLNPGKGRLLSSLKRDCNVMFKFFEDFSE